tara:strand:- start:4229 stop:4612 length:384 start_codon:yes stop_codon:yes gene_type:complete
MRSVKTARGKVIDMAALAAKNETARSVGNVLMNARGDRLNSDGTVKYTAQEIAQADAAQRTPATTTPISEPKPITPAPTPEPELEQPVVEPEPEAVSKITRTRDDGSKYAEIEYDDGSIETVELDEE